MPRTSNINRPAIRARARPNTSHTSPRQIELQKKRAAALDFRLQGYAFHRIGKEFGVNASTAHDWVVRAMRDLVPRETAAAVLEMELIRLDALMTAVYADAARGEPKNSATDLCNKIGQ